MARSVDAVDEYIARLSEDDPDSAVFIAAFESNEGLMQALIDAREAAGVSQRQLAKTMGTSASVVVHMEAGHSDPRQSTVARYAASLGKVVRWELVDSAVCQPAPPSKDEHMAILQRLAGKRAADPAQV